MRRLTNQDHYHPSPPPEVRSEMASSKCAAFVPPPQYRPTRERPSRLPLFTAELGTDFSVTTS